MTTTEHRAEDWAMSCVLVSVFCWIPPLLSGLSSYFLNDDIGWAEHGTFLRDELLAAVLLGLLPTFQLIGQRRLGPGRSVVVGLLASLAVHAVLVALLVVGSLALDGQGSVTAAQPQAPFYALVAGCIALAWACRQVGRRTASSVESALISAHG